MPRLTNNNYVERHRIARQIWLNDQNKYADLSHDQQRDLHDYYRPSEDLTEAELVAHRQEVTKENPSLPATASKAYNLLIAPRPKPTRPLYVPYGAKRKIRVRAVIRPDPDFKQLARALIALAEHQAREEMERKSQDLDK